MAETRPSDLFREHQAERRRCESAAPALPPDALTATPRELLPRDVMPGSVAGWQAVADGFLTGEACAFHRNVEISSRYAWIYGLLPGCLKWAGMAAIASHHVRLALFPLRLDTDRTGYVDIAHSLGRRRLLLMADVNTIRETNNAIFDDIFWVHLAYVAAADGIGHLHDLLRAEPSYARILSGFEAIDQGRRVLESASASAEARRRADDLVWEGNLQLLEHEQLALVQPHFDHLSSAFARLASLGSATRFEVRGMQQAYFTSFYLSSLTRGTLHALRGRPWPRITCFDDRWAWLTTSVVPRFRRFEADTPLIEAGQRRILDEARHYATIPCVPPLPEQMHGAHRTPRRPPRRPLDSREAVQEFE